jgi:hypothetical protein
LIIQENVMKEQKLCEACDRPATTERHGVPLCDKDAGMSDIIDKDDIADGVVYIPDAP